MRGTDILDVNGELGYFIVKFFEIGIEVVDAHDFFYNLLRTF